MKVHASVQRLCRFCRLTKRRGILFVFCTKKAKHKQRQGFATLAFPPTIPSPAAAAAAAAAPPLASKVAKEEMPTKFNWPLGLAALLKNGDK